MAFAGARAGMPSSVSFSSAGSAPLPNAEARVAQPASETWVRSSPPVGGGSAPAGGGGATRAARPSSPSRLPLRSRRTSAGCRRKVGARATSPASPTTALIRARVVSRGRAPRSKAAASAEAPASPTRIPPREMRNTAGSAPTPSPSASRCTPSGPPAPDFSRRTSISSAGSNEPNKTNTEAPGRKTKHKSTHIQNDARKGLRRGVCSALSRGHIELTVEGPMRGAPGE
eukprot:scaffold18788_cov62-Phaeocystis_antarctica.AAC.2